MQDCSISGLGFVSERGRDRNREEAQPEPCDSLLREHKLRCRIAKYAAWLLMPD